MCILRLIFPTFTDSRRLRSVFVRLPLYIYVINICNYTYTYAESFLSS